MGEKFPSGARPGETQAGHKQNNEEQDAGKLCQ